MVLPFFDTLFDVTWFLWCSWINIVNNKTLAQPISLWQAAGFRFAVIIYGCKFYYPILTHYYHNQTDYGKTNS
jgi:hypothetical protein